MVAGEGNSLLCQIFLHHVVNRVYVTNICKLKHLLTQYNIVPS